jgi:hypothetical protein
MARWWRVLAATVVAVVAAAPLARASTLSVPRAYAEGLLATVPVPTTATPVASLAVALGSAPTGLGGGSDVVGATHDYLVASGVDLPAFFAAHPAPGARLAQSGTSTGGGPDVHQILWTLACASRHTPECEVFAEFMTVGSHQELSVGVRLVWRPITVVHVPTTGVATLTGYGVTSLMDPSSHPVTVTLTSEQRARLSSVIASLKGAPGGMCMEDSGLFVIVVRGSGPGGAVTWRASADECPGTLTITWPGHHAALDARTCSLTREVRSLLPASARATRTALASCL